MSAKVALALAPLSPTSEGDAIIWELGWLDTCTAAGQSQDEAHDWLRRHRRAIGFQNPEMLVTGIFSK